MKRSLSDVHAELVRLEKWKELQQLVNSMDDIEELVQLRKSYTDVGFVNFVRGHIDAKLSTMVNRAADGNCPLLDLTTFAPICARLDKPHEIECAFAMLNEGQKTAVLAIVGCIKNMGSWGAFCLVDAQPGTGKSFLTSSLMRMMKKENLHFMVYLRSLMHDMKNQVPLANCMTVTEFFCNLLNKGMHEVNKFPTSKDDSVSETLEKIMEALHKYRGKFPKGTCLILDEFTVMNVWHYVFLLVFCLSNSYILICVGDTFQLPPIVQTSLFNKTNNTIFDMFLKAIPQTVPRAVCSLTKNERIKDEKYKTFITDLTHWMRSMNFDKKAYNLDFELMLKIFSTLREHFFREIKWDDMLLSENHYNLSQHQDRFEKESKCKTFSMFVIDNHGNRTELKSKEDSKFRTTLPLMPNEEYVHVTNRGQRIDCIFVGTSNTTAATTTTPTSGSSGSKTTRSYQFRRRQEKEEQLLSLVPAPIHNYLFPNDKKNHFQSLKPNETCSGPFTLPVVWKKTMTLAACQGTTIKLPPGKCVSLDLDNNRGRRAGAARLPQSRFNSGNALYVGLSRAENEAALGSIRYPRTASLELTTYFNDEYFYMLSDAPELTYRCQRSVRSNIAAFAAAFPRHKFTEVTSVLKFMDYGECMRKIKRTLYRQGRNMSRSKETDFTQKHMDELVRDVLDMAVDERDADVALGRVSVDDLCLF